MLNLDVWNNFFEQWPRSPQYLPQRIPFDTDRFEAFSTNFRDCYRNFCQRGGRINIWRAAGLKEDERRNSEVLKWLLDRYGDHGQGAAILERLVGLANRYRMSDVDVRDCHYRTIPESTILGDKDRRVDIEIESTSFLIIIEVKVNAAEHGSQLESYVELARTKAAGRPWLVIFLTKNGILPKDDKLHSDIVPMSWRDIREILLSCVKPVTCP